MEHMKNVCPLTGQVCNKPRLFHITEVENNQAKASFDLCEDCVRTYLEVADKPPEEAQEQVPEGMMDIFGLLSKVFGALAEQKAVSQKVKPQSPVNPQISKKCPGCGSTVEELMKMGKLGCPQCYDAFPLKGFISHMQGGATAQGEIKHVGKVPKRWKKEQEAKEQERLRNVPLDFRITSMKLKMDLAAKKENYEQASIFRDALALLEEKKVQHDVVKQAVRRASKHQDKPMIEKYHAQLEEILDQCIAIEADALVKAKA